MQRALKSALMVVVLLPLVARPLGADEIVDRVAELSKQVTPAVVEIRRDLHAHPELSNREERTGQVVAKRLKEIGVDDLQTGVARHGVVALIRGGKPGPTVALRADMDALPILEQTGLPFASQNRGVMHGCGHDCHVAMLLGAAEVLAQMRDVIPGTVKLIFQPAEEGVPPGEEGGARLMVEEGVLADPDVAAIFGMHVNTELETGKIAYRFGGLMAAVDRFKVTIRGKQSHAAMPWKSIDPVVTSAHVITAIQTIASRKVDAREPVVVTVGIIRAGEAWNIIPEEVVMEGTIRSHDVDVRRLAVREFKRIVEATAAAHGAKAEIVFDDYGPVVFNDPRLGAGAKVSLERAVGKENVVEAQPVMGGEDFAQYVAKIPGFYVFLGVRNEAIGAVHALHTPYMIVDEAAFPLGVRAHCLMALDFLQQQSQK
jgi:amidohydrolase